MAQPSSYDVMGGFLQQHAYKNVWCTPNQDKQAIFKPARLTDLNGAWMDFRVMWTKHKLPDQRSRFHIYQIGQIHPLLLGLQQSSKNVWISLADACIEMQMMADVYTVKGYQIHRSQIWYKVTPERDLILAIRIPEYDRIPIDLVQETIYVRLYTNAYFQSARANSQDNIVYVKGIQAVTTADIMAIQQVLNVYKAKEVGTTRCFVNGLLVDTIDLITAKPGDYMEFVFDGSVKKIITFDIGSLPQFESTLDNVYKFLLHYAGETDIIDYMDDVDLFLVKEDGQRYKGLYYNKNNPKAMRMVTHKDYAVPVQFLTAYAEEGSIFAPLNSLKLVLHVRNSGYDRPLVYEENRVRDLYKLDDEDLLQAMLGVNALVDVWKVENLENSAYIGLMSKNLGAITVDDVQNAYGYNAISVLIADTPQHTQLVSTLQRVQLPSALAMDCTVYEYDADGYMVGHSVHNSGTSYTCANPTTRLCEAISGAADIGLNSFWNVRTHSIDPDQNYRFYTCGKIGNILDNVWVDVTGSGQYTIINSVVTWVNNPDTTYTLVRPSKKHIYYELDYFAVDGLITFSLREWREDLQTFRTMAVPMGELDLFLNGKSLIEGLDYIVDFPRIVVNNKEYLVNPDTQPQKLGIRFSNFCKSDMTRPNVPDIGFVQYGVLSYNNKYDIRHDKVNRVNIRGALYRWDELNYGEDDFDIHVVDVMNGSPYSIRDIIVPMNDYLHQADEKIDPTFALRAKSMAIDKAISDYMTLKIPEKKPQPPSAIPALYQVVSPFFNRIVHDLNSGALWDAKFIEQYSDVFVRETCQRYEYLLAWDPVTDKNLLDPNFVVVHPHNTDGYIDMGVYQYKFLTRVALIYGSNRISLSGSIRVKQFGQ